jgi:hypothetical protein
VQICGRKQFGLTATENQLQASTEERNISTEDMNRREQRKIKIYKEYIKKLNNIIIMIINNNY